MFESSLSTSLDIHTAAKNNDVDTVIALVESNAGLLNKTDENGRTPLFVAAANGCKEVVAYLLKHEDIDAAINKPEKGEKNKLPVQCAVDGGFRDIVEMLLNAGAVSVIENGFEFIHIAAMNGHTDLVKFFLERDRALLNKTDSRGQTALLWAAAKGEKEVVRYLLKQVGIDQVGIDIELSTNCPTANEHGRSPLQWAVHGGYYDIVEMLLVAGAMMHDCIHIAVKAGHFDIMKLLLNVGAIKQDLIHIAAKAGHFHIVAFLLNQNPELLNAIDAKGKTPLILASAQDHRDIMNYLIQEGADVNVVINSHEHDPHHGYSALRLARERNHDAAAELLIKAGAIDEPLNRNFCLETDPPTISQNRNITWAAENKHPENKRSCGSESKLKPKRILKKNSSNLICRIDHLERKKQQILKLLQQHEIPPRVFDTWFANFSQERSALSDLYHAINQASFSETSLLNLTANDILNDIIENWEHTNPNVHMGNKNIFFSLNNQLPTPLEKVWQKIKIIINPELGTEDNVEEKVTFTP